MTKLSVDQVDQGEQPDQPKDRMLQFFEYAHLPAHLQDTSKKFHEMAHWVADTLPSNPERTVALRKLLEAKDAAVRSAIYKETF